MKLSFTSQDLSSSLSARAADMVVLTTCSLVRRLKRFKIRGSALVAPHPCGRVSVGVLTSHCDFPELERRCCIACSLSRNRAADMWRWIFSVDLESSLDNQQTVRYMTLPWKRNASTNVFGNSCLLVVFPTKSYAFRCLLEVWQSDTSAHL